MRLKFILGSVLIVAILVVAGCGGGGDSTSSGETAGETGSTTTAKSEGGETTEKGGESTEKAEGGEAEGEKSKPMTKTVYLTRVNEICIQVPPTYTEELKKLEKENGGKKPSKAETNLKAAIPPLESAMEQMEAITPPAAEEGTLEEVISALQAAIKGLEEEPTSKLSGPGSPFVEFQKITKESGMETCSGL